MGMGKKDSAEKIKVYTYTRVSTAMQIDGFSLDEQKAFADYNDYETQTSHTIWCGKFELLTSYHHL